MPPPALAGRDDLLDGAKVAIRRSRTGRSARSFIYVGLRGVGKTVLLNEVEHYAESVGAFTDFIEVSKNVPFASVLAATLRAALIRLDRQKGVNEKVKRGLRVLKSFVSAVKVTYQDMDVSLDFEAESGVADSGNLSRDLPELFVAVGEAARSRSASVVILIDEIQNLPRAEFEAVVMAVHRVNQTRLPILVVGAGLPLLVRLTGEAKSYAERLFEYPEVGALDESEARRALVEAAMPEGVAFDGEAVDAIVRVTGGYPYFIQEWGYQAWNVAERSPITLADVDKAGADAVARLDRNFFRSRYDRLTDMQKRYLRAMASLGEGPYTSGAIAAAMGKRTQQLGVTRQALIESGMIYTPKYGLTEFTVPLFGDFMLRSVPSYG